MWIRYSAMTVKLAIVQQPLFSNGSANVPFARQQIYNLQQWYNWEDVFSLWSM
jgi:hypothetical protein